MSQRELTPEEAERITALAARLVEVIANEGRDLPWSSLFMALGIAVRGNVEVAVHKFGREHPEVPAEVARASLIKQAFLDVTMMLAAPPELVRILDDGKGDGKIEVGVIPARRH